MSMCERVQFYKWIFFPLFFFQWKSVLLFFTSFKNTHTHTCLYVHYIPAQEALNPPKTKSIFSDADAYYSSTIVYARARNNNKPLFWICQEILDFYIKRTDSLEIFFFLLLSYLIRSNSQEMWARAAVIFYRPVKNENQLNSVSLLNYSSINKRTKRIFLILLTSLQLHNERVNAEKEKVSDLLESISETTTVIN